MLTAEPDLQLKIDSLRSVGRLNCCYSSSAAHSCPLDLAEINDEDFCPHLNIYVYKSGA